MTTSKVYFVPHGELPSIASNADGDTNYCGSRCGRGCTLNEFDKAMDAARDTQAQMGGAWVGRVWENLGWHWEVRLELDDDNWISVRKRRKTDTYDADCRVNGKQFNTWHSEIGADTPKWAAKQVMAKAEDKTTDILKCCRKLGVAL